MNEIRTTHKFQGDTQQTHTHSKPHVYKCKIASIHRLPFVGRVIWIYRARTSNILFDMIFNAFQMNFVFVVVVVFAYSKMLISSPNVCYILWSQKLNRKLYRLCQVLKVLWNTFKMNNNHFFFFFSNDLKISFSEWQCVVDDTMACISFPQFKVYVWNVNIVTHSMNTKYKNCFLILIFLFSFLFESIKVVLEWCTFQ